MGNLDVPKVIQAAASSNLGVLSLLVLVLAFLAWRFFQRSDDRVKLVAFGLIFLGAIGFGASIFVASGSRDAKAGPASGPSSPPSTTPASPSPASGGGQTVDVSGAWQGDDGYRFRFTQQGNRIRYEALHHGNPAGSGEGTIQGGTLRYRFEDRESGDQGSCEANLSEDGQMITGSCRSDGGGAAWELAIKR